MSPNKIRDFYFVTSNKFSIFATKRTIWTKNFFALSYLKIRNI